MAGSLGSTTTAATAEEVERTCKCSCRYITWHASEESMHKQRNCTYNKGTRLHAYVLVASTKHSAQQHHLHELHHLLCCISLILTNLQRQCPVQVTRPATNQHFKVFADA